MFYETEIAIRKQLKYPPFCDIIVIEFSGEKEFEVIKQIGKGSFGIVLLVRRIKDQKI